MMYNMIVNGDVDVGRWKSYLSGLNPRRTCKEEESG